MPTRGTKNRALAPGLAAVLILAVVCLGSAAENSKTPKDFPQDDIFAGTNVLRLRLLIPNSGIAELRNSGWGRGQERPKVRAIVREGSRIYTNVEVHLKGAA